MPYYNHAWHLFSETERRAYGEAQRESAARHGTHNGSAAQD